MPWQAKPSGRTHLHWSWFASWRNVCGCPTLSQIRGVLCARRLLLRSLLVRLQLRGSLPALLTYTPLLGCWSDEDRSVQALGIVARSEEHTSELQSLMRISYAVFCLNKKKQ